MTPDDMTTSESEVDVAKSDPTFTLGNKTTQGSYKCSFPGCNQRFARQVKLDRHEYAHTGERKHVCTFEGCEKSYTISTHLKRHVKAVHEHFRPEKSIKCPIDNCKKTFNFAYNMERHVREVHENAKVYPCPDCPSKFPRKIQLRKHMITHTGEYPFKCDNCQKGFILQGLYDRHTCNPKTYKCDSCEKEFPNWSSLVAHRRTDHKSCYKCDQCGKILKRKEYLKMHLERHKDATEREVLKCPWKDCDRSYYHARNLKTHIRSKHEGEKYKCPYEGCNQELTTKQKLAYHARLHEIGPGTSKKPEPTKAKADRSDKGKKKKSYASVLAGVILKPDVEKVILSGEGKDIDIAAPDASEVSDTDDEVPLVKRVELLIP